MTDGAGVVLLRVMGDYVVDARHVCQLGEEFVHHGWVNRIEQSYFVRAVDQVCVIGGAVGQRDERIEEAPIPVHCSHPTDTTSYISMIHDCASKSFCSVALTMPPHGSD